MEDVIEYRLRHDQIPPSLGVEVDGYVAVPYCQDLGKVVLARPEGSEEWETFLVADCGSVYDGGRQWMLQNDVLIEVGHATATRWNTVGQMKDVEATAPIPLHRFLDTYTEPCEPLDPWLVRKLEQIK